jgi:hypothetical protein
VDIEDGDGVAAEVDGEEEGAVVAERTRSEADRNIDGSAGRGDFPSWQSHFQDSPSAICSVRELPNFR